jgi:hypothetical protein
MKDEQNSLKGFYITLVVVKKDISEMMPIFVNVKST